LPELPEVETVRRGLDQLTHSQIIQGGEVLLPRTLAYPVSVDDFWTNLIGKAIASWHRRGKYLIAQLSPSGGLGVHLRMTGQLLWVERTVPVQKHTRFRLFLGEDRELRFVDVRSFGKIWLIPASEKPETIITGLQQLGVEPLSKDFSVDYLAQKLEKRNRCIKTLLLDQNIIAGLGNIYADEVLFKSGILPDTLGKDLTQKQIEKLRSAIIEVLEKAIAEGGTTFSDFLNPLGVNGNYGGIAWVYRRTGQPCRICQTPITRIKIGGRSTHFCPQCQK
jgi:formamidopyrimidine-DNA glycosylase